MAGNLINTKMLQIYLNINKNSTAINIAIWLLYFTSLLGKSLIISNFKLHVLKCEKKNAFTSQYFLSDASWLHVWLSKVCLECTPHVV